VFDLWLTTNLQLQTQNVDLEGNAEYLEHCYQQLQSEFDKAKHLNEQYLKEKNDLIQERSDLVWLLVSSRNFTQFHSGTPG